MEELDLARELADIADEISMRWFRRNPEIQTKKDGTLVTMADQEIEKALRSRLAEVFPDHGVLGEEEGLIGDPTGPVWVLDPIDGTNNFAAGIPIFGTLIGFHASGATRVGIATAPALKERYEAALGDGARMNGEPIRVSDKKDLGEAMVVSGGTKWFQKSSYFEKWTGIVDRAWRDRTFGDFWGHMLVARGAAEVMAEPMLAAWDVVALEVIVAEAGGRMTTFEGEPYPHGWKTDLKAPSSILSSNGVLHDEVIDLLRG